MTRVFVGMPCYRRALEQVRPGYDRPAVRRDTTSRTIRGSMLARNFNKLWCLCYNSRVTEGWTHFAMLHADVEAPPGWLDLLLDEMERISVDVMATVIPMKDATGLTSTGGFTGDGTVRRATLRELYDGPATISEFAGLPLAINTGLWVCRLGSWIEAFPGFAVHDGLGRTPDGELEPVTLGEDFAFSEWAHRNGLKLAATRLVPVNHWGLDDDGAPKAFPNTHAWGTWATDLSD